MCGFLFHAAHALQVGYAVGRCGQGEVVSDLMQSARVKLAYSMLLFENSEDRLDDGFAPRIGDLSGHASQFGFHAVELVSALAQKALVLVDARQLIQATSLQPLHAPLHLGQSLV